MGAGVIQKWLRSAGDGEGAQDRRDGETQQSVGTSGACIYVYVRSLEPRTPRYYIASYPSSLVRAVMAPAASLAFLGTQMEFMWYPFVELTPSAGSSEFRTWGQRGGSG